METIDRDEYRIYFKCIKHYLNLSYDSILPFERSIEDCYTYAKNHTYDEFCAIDEYNVMTISDFIRDIEEIRERYDNIIYYQTPGLVETDSEDF